MLDNPLAERLSGMTAALLQRSVAVGAAFLLRRGFAVAQQVQFAHAPVAGCNDIAMQPL
jgi:hypothetical protein